MTQPSNTLPDLRSLALPTPEKTALTVGFIPLFDCLPLSVAHQQGYFAEVGLDIRLSQESSWASIRDKVQFGLLDAAPMPAGIVLASHLGLGAAQPMVTAMGLGLNGNGITLATPLYEQLELAQPNSPADCAAALKALIEHQARPLNIASVHTYSTHHILLRDWLRANAVDPEQRLHHCVVPPPQMVSAMARGTIDLFCVGEPWNSIAQYQGIGTPLLWGEQIWPAAPDKVLAVTQQWCQRYPATHQRLLAALLKACSWLADNTHSLSGFRELLTHHFPDIPATAIDLLAGGHRFAPPYATQLQPTHAEHFLRHICQISQVLSVNPAQIISACYQSDVYDALTHQLHMDRAPQAPLPDFRSGQASSSAQT